MKGYPLPNLECIKDSILLMTTLLKDCDFNLIDYKNKENKELIVRVIESLAI